MKTVAMVAAPSGGGVAPGPDPGLAPPTPMVAALIAQEPSVARPRTHPRPFRRGVAALMAIVGGPADEDIAAIIADTIDYERRSRNVVPDIPLLLACVDGHIASPYVCERVCETLLGIMGTTAVDRVEDIVATPVVRTVYDAGVPVRLLTALVRHPTNVGLYITVGQMVYQFTFLGPDEREALVPFMEPLHGMYHRFRGETMIGRTHMCALRTFEALTTTRAGSALVLARPALFQDPRFVSGNQWDLTVLRVLSNVCENPFQPEQAFAAAAIPQFLLVLHTSFKEHHLGRSLCYEAVHGLCVVLKKFPQLRERFNAGVAELGTAAPSLIAHLDEIASCVVIDRLNDELAKLKDILGIQEPGMCAISRRSATRKRRRYSGSRRHRRKN